MCFVCYIYKYSDEEILEEKILGQHGRGRTTGSTHWKRIHYSLPPGTPQRRELRERYLKRKEETERRRYDLRQDSKCGKRKVCV